MQSTANGNGSNRGSNEGIEVSIRPPEQALVEDSDEEFDQGDDTARSAVRAILEGPTFAAFRADPRGYLRVGVLEREVRIWAGYKTALVQLPERIMRKQEAGQGGRKWLLRGGGARPGDREGGTDQFLPTRDVRFAGRENARPSAKGLSQTLKGGMGTAPGSPRGAARGSRTALRSAETESLVLELPGTPQPVGGASRTRPFRMMIAPDRNRRPALRLLRFSWTGCRLGSASCRRLPALADAQRAVFRPEPSPRPPEDACDHRSRLRSFSSRRSTKCSNRARKVFRKP